ncbi:hypothetical protein [Arthrobacter sp. HMWF013]|uniref:hypothetical protein n=1 Tax=Arthrobacter sp. HMWF013 TaxID=2056849 RepID=UPI0015E7FE81|nr:hypothetical protein [Arthrobacter sp. HMWF013]
MTPHDENRHDRLEDLDPESLRRYRLARLAGNDQMERHIRMMGLEETATLAKRYAKEQKVIAGVGREAGLDVEDLAVMHRGDEDPRAAAWAQAIALEHPEGTPDNDRMRAFIGLPTATPGTPSPLIVQEHDGPSAGAIEYRICLAAPEEGINAAVTSLGDRTGDDEEEITADLQAALHKHLVGLDLEHIRSIAVELTLGEEVVVRIVPDSEPTGISRPPSASL